MGDKYIAWLSNLSKKDLSLAGGKGANLGEMFQEKFPVPGAFVITTNAFHYFLKENNLFPYFHSENNFLPLFSKRK